MKKLLFLILFITNCSILSLVKNRLPQPHKVNDGYIFQIDRPSAYSVQIAGTFNEWAGTTSSDGRLDPKIGKMLKNDKGIWTIILKLPTGRHKYKFVINKNSWITDPNNRNLDDEGNSFILVK